MARRSKDREKIINPNVVLLPLKSDIIFKLVFGDPRYIRIIRAFLLVTLDIPEEEYERVEIIDPHLERDSPDDKLGILDVRVQLKNRQLISVEVQIRETPFMAERIAFSTGRNLARQIAPGQGYSKIEKVVTIVITNYDMIRADNCYHHRFKLYDADKQVLFTDIVEVHTLELGKLPDGLAESERENELLNWLRLIRSEKKEEIEMLATQTPEMELAVGRLKQLSSDERTRLLYEARELAVMDEMARNEAALAKGRMEGLEEGLTKGLKKGLEKGMEKGLEEGLTKGLKKGLAKGRAEVAKNMLDNGFEIDVIANVTGLTISEIMSLQ
jgi:predicted transposase/invertase (TIGR01784 family)